MMKTFRFALLALFLCAALLLSGCGLIMFPTTDAPLDTSNSDADDTADVTVATTASAETNNTPVDLSSLVTDAYYNKIEYHETLNDRDVTLEYALPRIQLDSAAVEAVNNEILAIYQPIIDKELNAYEKELSNICISIAYDWTVNGDVLSLIITTVNDWHDPDPYRVYNISIKDSRPLTTEEMYDIVDLDQAKIKDMLGSYFFDMYAGISPEDFGGFYYVQLENTITDDNAAQAMIYFDKTGNTCVVGKIYAMAGANYYSYIIPTNSYVPNPDYAAYVSGR